MRNRREYQVPCPICRASAGRPCTGSQSERLHGVHFQRTAALRRAILEALRLVYAPLPTTASVQGR